MVDQYAGVCRVLRRGQQQVDDTQHDKGADGSGNDLPLPPGGSKDAVEIDDLGNLVVVEAGPAVGVGLFG